MYILLCVLQYAILDGCDVSKPAQKKQEKSAGENGDTYVLVMMM